MFRFVFSFAAAFLAISLPPASAQTVAVGFEDLPTGFAATPPGTGSYANGQFYSPNATTSFSTTFTSYGAPGVGATFNTSYNSSFGGFSSRWSSSSVFNNTTGDFTNQYAAYNLAGGTGQNGSAGSSTYGIANGSSSTITLAEGYRINSIDITNTTYAYTVIRDGNQFSRAFGPQDYFLLTITGKNAGGTVTGTKDFYLADYRSQQALERYIVDQWTSVDLSAFGSDTRTLSFGFTSTDVGQFGSNTPEYFAADNLVLTLVPEPGAILALGAGMGLLVRWRRRKAK